MEMRKESPLVNPCQTENLEAILADLTARGVEFALIDGVFRYCDENNALSRNEEIGIDVIRPSLTEYLRLQAGLCVACAGTPAHATRPSYPAALRAKYPPLQYSPSWCEACYQAGARKVGL